MVLVLLLSLALPGPSEVGSAAVRDTLPVQVWLNQDNAFRRGDHAQVHVRVAEDGNVVVLRADANGRIRVLYPLDPGDDNFVRGGETLEIHGRGGREAFAIDEREGSGLVLAARSVTPFKFAEFVRGDHWDYGVLTARAAGDDKEQALLDVVQRMAPDGHFDYDAVSYSVASPQANHDGYDWYTSSVGLHLGYGYGYPRSFSFSLAFGDPFFFRPFFIRPSCFDPFFFDPFFCDRFFFDPFFFDPFFFHHRFFFPPVFVFSRSVIVVHGGTRVGFGIPFRRGGLVIDRARPRVGGPFVFKDPSSITAMGPRLRMPMGALRRPTPVNAAGRRESIGRHAATPIWERRPHLEQHLPAPRIEDRPRVPVREPPVPIWDRRQRAFERAEPLPAARRPERLEVPRAWRAPERARQPGFSGGTWTPTIRDRGSSAVGVFGLPSRPLGSLSRGGGRRH